MRNVRSTHPLTKHDKFVSSLKLVQNGLVDPQAAVKHIQRLEANAVPRNQSNNTLTKGQLAQLQVKEAFEALTRPPWRISQMDFANGGFRKGLALVRNQRRINDDHMQAFSIASGALPNLTHLGLAVNNITGGGMQAFASAVASGALPKLTNLSLMENKIGDGGMQAFASAVASGALPNLTHLYLEENQIGNGGMRAFVSAVAIGSLPQLRELWLNDNQIGDGGMQAFAAFTSGSLPQLRMLHLDSTQIGDAGMQAFASAVASGALPQLRELWLQSNQIGDGGMRAFASAVASGVPNLTFLYLVRNKATEVGKEAMRDVAKARGFHVYV